jgi:hypothetical protein
MPEGYGTPETLECLIEWADVERRLVEAVSFWVATTCPDGRPHVVPRWGVWVDRRFFYDGSPDTVHARNLRHDPRCVLHLEDGNEVVILEGQSVYGESPEPDLAGRLSDAFGAKYGGRGYHPSPDAWDGPDAGGLLVFTPRKAMAWFDFPNDVTRFRFEW